MLIFTHHDSPRLRYAAHELFAPLGIACRFTAEESVFAAEQGPRLKYSRSANADELHIPFVADVLWQGQPQRHGVEQGQWHSIPTLYVGEGSIPFDVFGAVFFLLTRYEEYWPFEGDSIGRFSAQNSLTGQSDFLQRPVIDEWRMRLREELLSRWPTAPITAPAYGKVSTVDLDSAFAYVGKGLKRSAMGIAKDVWHGHWQNLRQRLATWMGVQHDKYDTYSYMHDVVRRSGCEHLYFVQLSDWSAYDRNVRHTSPRLRRMIQALNREFAVGIHPGVRSNTAVSIFKAEKHRLEEIIGSPVSKSRQHYLVLKFPDTYRTLLQMDITEDYTMGYADAIGFRAGTSRPFMWYDVQGDTVTPLKVHPIAMMDTTLRKYMKMTPDAAITLSREVIQRIRSAHGIALVLWHNETLSETDGWQGWRRVWEAQLAE